MYVCIFFVIFIPSVYLYIIFFFRENASSNFLTFLNVLECFCCWSYSIYILMPKVMICWWLLLNHFFLIFPPKKETVLKINSKYALKIQLCSSPPFFFYYPSLKHNMREFLVWFSAGLSCYLSWGVLLEAGVSPQSWPRRSGMWCWRHSRSWECFAFLFLAVVRWLPARRKDNSFQRRKKKRRKRTVYNQTIVEEALLFWAKIEIRSICLSFWCCTNVKYIY